MTAHNDIDAQIAALEQHLAEPEFSNEDLAVAQRILRQAFRHGLEESHSPAGAFAGARAKARNESLYRSRPAPDRFQELGYPEGVSSVWASRVHASESQRAHFSRPPMAGSLDNNSARVHAIVNALPEAHLVLIRAEFMKPGPMQGAYAERLKRAFWLEYAPRTAAGLDRRVLMEMACAVIATHGEPHRSFAIILRDHLKVTPENWSRRYARHWRAMLLDYEGRKRAALTAFLVKY